MGSSKNQESMLADQARELYRLNNALTERDREIERLRAGLADATKKGADLAIRHANDAVEIDQLRTQLEEARASNKVLSDELLDIGELVGGDGQVYTRVRIAMDSAAARDAELQAATDELSHCRKLLDAAGYHQGIHNGIQAAIQRADLFVEACTKALNERDAAIQRAEDLKKNQDHIQDRIQAALGNGADEQAWEPGEHWLMAACRGLSALAAARKALERIRLLLDYTSKTSIGEAKAIANTALNGDSHAEG